VRWGVRRSVAMMRCAAPLILSSLIGRLRQRGRSERRHTEIGGPSPDRIGEGNDPSDRSSQFELPLRVSILSLCVPGCLSTIRSEAVNELAERLAAHTRMNKTDAVRTALENELRSLDQAAPLRGPTASAARPYFEPACHESGRGQGIL
jgi:hypothetical protein